MQFPRISYAISAVYSYARIAYALSISNGRRGMEKLNICETIETLIDQSSVLDVLTAIECICSEKAAHIRHNWQDNLMARQWDSASKQAGRAARNVAV